MKGFELLQSVEAELQIEFLPGAYSWMDKHKDSAFSQLVARMENAIFDLQKNGSFELYKNELEIYKKALCDLLIEYKNSKNINEIDGFMNSIKSTYSKK